MIDEIKMQEETPEVEEEEIDTEEKEEDEDIESEEEEQYNLSIKLVAKNPLQFVRGFSF